LHTDWGQSNGQESVYIGEVWTKYVDVVLLCILGGRTMSGIARGGVQQLVEQKIG